MIQCYILAFGDRGRYNSLFFATPKDYYSIEKETIPYNRFLIFGIICIFSISVFYKPVSYSIGIISSINDFLVHYIFEILHNLLCCFEVINPEINIIFIELFYYKCNVRHSAIWQIYQFPYQILVGLEVNFFIIVGFIYFDDTLNFHKNINKVAVS